jgi:hypothetical protein
MDRPYDSIPRQGKHQGEDVHEEPSTNVRAQEASPPDTEDKAQAAEAAEDAGTPDGSGRRILQFSQYQAHGRYRLRRWTEETGMKAAEGFEEISRSADDDVSASAVFDQLPEGPLYVVFENLENGEVFYERDSDLAGSWMGDSEYDQVTIFEDEEAAAEYAASRGA